MAWKPVTKMRLLVRSYLSSSVTWLSAIARLPGQCALATIRALGSVNTYSPRPRGSNAKNMSGLAISRRSPRRKGNVGAAVAGAFWRTAAQVAVPVSQSGLEARDVRLAEPPGLFYNRVPIPGPEIPADGCPRRPP